MHIGVAGLGAMGGNVAARLMEVGHQVTVWNRSPDKTKPLADAGAKVAALGVALAAAEVLMAKLRLFRVPELMAGAFVLSVLAVISVAIA